MNIYNSKLPNLFKPKNEKTWAVTIGSLSFFNVPKESVGKAWQAHEDKHKEQWKKYWYIGFLIMYLYYNFTYGYSRNPFEVEAEVAEALAGE